MLAELKDLARDDIPLLSQEAVVTHGINGKLLAEDRDLFTLKWWDYRFKSPLEATLEYIDAFGAEYRRAYAREIDFERAQYVGTATAAMTLERLREAAQGILTEDQRRRDIKNRAYLTAFWRGRQVADALGMPYNLFISEALTERLRYWKGSFFNPKTGKFGKQTLPGPDKIYLDWVVEKVALRWEEIKEARMLFAEHDAYMPGNFKDLPVQREYFRFLIERARRSPDFSQSIADLIRGDRLPYEFVQKELGEGFDSVRSALS